jgi:hypothetical protein
MEDSAYITGDFDATWLALQRRYGVVVSGADLVRLLGYRSSSAFRMAAQRRTLPIPTFFIPGRRGRCARTQDIAHWANTPKAPCKGR